MLDATNPQRYGEEFMKILMRAHMNPESNYSPSEVIFEDKIGSNIGNMLFPDSIVRWVNGDNKIVIDSCGDNHNLSYSEINQKYDMLILPFANAFRDNFIPVLNRWTLLIKKLTIPCVVIGIGLQARIKGNEEIEPYRFSFDNDVLEFCNAVLEKSSQIGVRGEITKAYLVSIGVPEDRICSIGCPSMFVNGFDKVTVQKRDFNEIDRIGFNTAKNNVCVPIIEKWMGEYNNSIFISQETWELLLLYTGFLSRKIDNGYFVNYTHDYYQTGRIVSFTDSLTWLNYLDKNIQLNVGTRIHGNIAAAIVGAPSLIINTDTRVKELAEFFCMPNRDVNIVLNEEEESVLESWYDEADYDKFNRRYDEALKIYCQFLDKNNIPYIVLDKRVDLSENIIGGGGVIHPCSTIPTIQRDYQVNDYINYITKKLNNELKQKKKELKAKDKELHKIERSKAYKTGNMILYVPKKIKRVLNK